MAGSFILSPENIDYLLRKQNQAVGALRAGEKLLEQIANLLRKEIHEYGLYSVRPEVKRTRRIMRKIKEEMEKDPNKTVEQAIDVMKDLAGGRIFVLYLKNVSGAYEILSRFIEGKPKTARLDGPPEDYINAPKKSGYRGLHQSVILKIAPRTYFPFEIQFLTFLQADWAEKEHVVYENSERIPDEIKGKLRELSNTFHSISAVSDQLREEIDSLLSN